MLTVVPGPGEGAEDPSRASSSPVIDELVREGARRMLAEALQARRCLGRWSSFPSLDAARAALAEPRGGEAERCAPVDPDAIVFTSPPIPDRLR